MDRELWGCIPSDTLEISQMASSSPVYRASYCYFLFAINLLILNKLEDQQISIGNEIKKLTLQSIQYLNIFFEKKTKEIKNKIKKLTSH